MGVDKMPQARADAGGNFQYYSASSSSAILPKNGTTYACTIHIPYAHYLRGAWVTTTDIDVVGSLAVTLVEADDGDSAAGTTVATATSTATSDTLEAEELTIGSAYASAALAAGKTYYLKMVGTNAGDLYESPSLTLAVEPTDRSTL